MACECGEGRGGDCLCPGRGGRLVPRAGPVIVFFRKHTALLGLQEGSTYFSDPVDVTGWKTLTTEVAWLSAAPTGGMVESWLETGSDLSQWTKLGGDLNPAEGSTIVGTRADPAHFVRMGIKVTSVGSEGMVVVWARAVAKPR